MVKKRNTRQKELINHKIESFNRFFTAEELLAELKKDDKNLGIATIYRHLKQLKEFNQLYSYKCDRKSIFSKQNSSHCHFICEKTGKVTHFNIDSLDFLKDKIPGTITSFQLEVRGNCKDDCKVCKKEKLPNKSAYKNLKK